MTQPATCSSVRTIEYEPAVHVEKVECGELLIVRLVLPEKREEVRPEATSGALNAAS